VSPVSPKLLIGAWYVHAPGDDLVDGLIGTLIIVSVNSLTLSWDMPWEIGCGSVDRRFSSWPKSPDPYLPQ
jgi:hypothetical protein